MIVDRACRAAVRDHAALAAHRAIGLGVHVLAAELALAFTDLVGRAVLGLRGLRLDRQIVAELVIAAVHATAHCRVRATGAGAEVAAR